MSDFIERLHESPLGRADGFYGVYIEGQHG